LYVPVDFVVVETGGYEKAPLILGQPFLRTTKAIIYIDDAKICFTIKGKKERFTFKNKTLQSPAHQFDLRALVHPTGQYKPAPTPWV
jgi:hypothetical protein